jgi:hypothetical protein
MKNSDMLHISKMFERILFHYNHQTLFIKMVPAVLISDMPAFNIA